MTPEHAQSIDHTQITSKMITLLGKPLTELTFARTVMLWYQQEDKYREALETARVYACWALYTQEGRRRHQNGILFQLPHKTRSVSLR